MVFQYVAAILAKGFTSAIRYRMAFIRAFQERLSELGMGLFISANAEDFDTAIDLLGWTNNVINAYLSFVGRGLIYGKHGEEIISNLNLTRYFQQFPSFQYFQDNYFKTGKTWTKPIIDLEFLKALIEQSGFYRLVDLAEDYMNNPFELMVTLYRLLAEQLNFQYDEITKIINEINQRLADPGAEITKTMLEPNQCMLVNPFIDLDWTVIKTYIQLYITYIDHFDAIEEEQAKRFHLWHGTRNIWAEWTENNVTKRKLLRGSFEDIDYIISEPGTVGYQRFWKEINYLQIWEYMPRSGRFTLSIPTKDFEKLGDLTDAETIDILLEHEGIESNRITLPNFALLKQLEKLDQDFINAFYNVILIITDHMLCENVLYGSYNYEIPLKDLKQDYLTIDTDEIKCFVINANEIENASPYTKVFATLLKLQGDHYTVFAVPDKQLRIPDYISQYNVKCSLICTPCPDSGPYNLAIGKTLTLQNDILDNCNQKRYLEKISTRASEWTVITKAINKITHDFII